LIWHYSTLFNNSDRIPISAMALKAFSCSHLTKRIYRALGNTLGSKKRAVGQMPTYYLDRINRMLRIANELGVPKNGDRLIELGTGWLHWEAITTKLFYNVHGILFDVWDNRQMDGLKNYIEQLDNSLDKLDADNIQRTSAHKLISKIREVTGYDDLYKLLGFEYVLDHRGSLNLLEKESFDLVVSAGVLEHIYAKDASDFVYGIATLLKPGGYSVHSINIRDHLCQYDSTVSCKQYLQYPHWVWSLCFENDVQYINRIQRSEWLELFRKAGLVLVEEEVETEDLSGLKVATVYQKYDENDLRCGGLNLVHRKPV
ncbi:MAG: methyltransferase domain-containing protein, partial [Candidatus Competibacteraceae bacterium]